jgi:hypothetical protein
MCQPAGDETPIYSDFNRKDLFTQHLRRMHKNHPLTGSTITNAFGEVSISDEAISEHQTRCYMVLRTNPTQSSCLFCNERFVGEDSWEKRMNHVGQHMEKDRKAKRSVVAVESWHEDLQLRDYFESEGLIVRSEDGNWMVGDGKPRRGQPLSSEQDHRARLPQNYSKDRAILEQLFAIPFEEWRPSPSPSPPSDKDDGSNESDDSFSCTPLESPEPISPYAELLHELMTTFSVPFHRTLQEVARNFRQRQQTQDGSSGTQSSTSASGNSANGASSEKSSTSGKRRRVNQGDRNGDEDGLDGNGQKKTRLSSFGEPNASQDRFACFFYKRNPIKYKNHRSCPGPGWLDVHRLK